MQTGSGSSDSGRLLDHGYRTIFTPDRCAFREFPEPGGLVGPEGPVRVKTFAIDHMEGAEGVTAIIDDHEDLRLNIWDLSSAGESITSLGFTARKFALTGGTTHAPPNLVELDTISASNGVTDHFAASVHGEHLDLSLWRVGDAP
jgi:hypothetical protein